jgi:hypothetical protein
LNLIEVWRFRSYKIDYTLEASDLSRFEFAQSQEKRSKLPTPPKPGGMGHPKIQPRLKGCATREYAPFVNVYEDENSGRLHCRNSAGGQLG